MHPRALILIQTDAVDDSVNRWVVAQWNRAAGLRLTFK